MKHNYDESIYLKWLNNELTSEELSLLEENGDLKVLEAIKEQTDNWTLPEPDNKLKEILASPKRRNENTKVIKLMIAWRVAASLILIGTLSYFTYARFFDITTYNTLAQESKEVTLPDGSIIVLNANSELSFNNYNWEEDRIVDLKGQAFFKVTKKGDFLVNFKHGSVAVLGTEFDIIDHKNITRVTCYEGKVKAIVNNEDHILEQGMGIRSNSTDVIPFTTEEASPSWANNATLFNNASFAEVVVALELKYGITIELKDNTILNKSFTGQFVNNDLELALKMVTSPLGLTTEVRGKTITISTK